MLPVLALLFKGIVLLAGAALVTSLIDFIAATPRRVSRENITKIVISFYGPASAGKSSGIKALFGIKCSSIHPIPGTTQNVSFWELEKGLSVADTPGLQDTNEELVSKAKGFIDNTDIFVYVINSNGGITEKVIDDLNLLKAVGRPLLVVLNKIDTIKENERETFVENQFLASCMNRDSFLAVAFDPLPKISEKPLNIESVKIWINLIIEEKGETLLKEKQNAEII